MRKTGQDSPWLCAIGQVTRSTQIVCFCIKKLKLPPEAGRGLDETMRKAAGHTVTVQQRLAVNTVDVVTTSGGSFCTEPRRPWRQGG